MKNSLVLLIVLVLLLPLSAQEKIEEQVSIDWWVLPLFAVDKDGNAVEDLKDGDIDLRVNGRRVADFELYKRNFGVEASVKEKPAQKKILNLNKRKIIFFIFDNAFSEKKYFNQSIEIAKNLVKKAETGTMFAVISLEFYAGLVHRGGPTANKEEVLKLIDEEINFRGNSRDWRTALYLANANANIGMKHGGRLQASGRLDNEGSVVGNVELLLEGLYKSIQKADFEFFESFRTLYYALNSIKDNKFVYLFSEGIKMFAMRAMTRARVEYQFKLRDAARFLGRSGAVIFIVNPAGTGKFTESHDSGENTLLLLAQESGGKYLEGDETGINLRIEKMTRSYYEIAFPEQTEFKNAIRSLSIAAIRKGVHIHSLRNLEKSKTYREMQDIEKEVLVLNLLADSPLFQAPLKTRPLEVGFSGGKENTTAFRVNLPREFKNGRLDIYKIKVNGDKTAIEKKTVHSAANPLDISVKKEESSHSRLVIINEELNTALIQGLFDPQSLKAKILAKAGTDFKKRMAEMSPQDIEELEKIKDGALRYSLKLQEEAFRYICKEKVSEVLEVFDARESGRATPYAGNSLEFIDSNYSRSSKVHLEKRKLINTYVNDYQIISNKGEVKEQRKLLERSVKETGNQNTLLRLDTFISKGIALLPVSLFAARNQEKFHFLLLKHEEIGGVKTAVIECIPKNPARVNSIFGTLWVDLQDFSLVRMSVNPVSIGGYENMLSLAERLDAKPLLYCRIDFGKKSQGIRFPTSVQIREKYSGGAQVRSMTGKGSWERSKTQFTFDDYKFFTVSSDSREENVTD